MIHITEDDFIHGLNETIKQGVQCMDDGVCSYQNDEGQRCVIGHMVGDEIDLLKDIDKPADDLVNSGVIKTDVPVDALQIAQRIHDSPNPDEFFLWRIKEAKFKTKLEEALIKFYENWGK